MPVVLTGTGRDTILIHCHQMYHSLKLTCGQLLSLPFKHEFKAKKKISLTVYMSSSKKFAIHKIAVSDSMRHPWAFYVEGIYYVPLH
jgi:hypothetical protein